MTQGDDAGSARRPGAGAEGPWHLSRRQLLIGGGAVAGVAAAGWYTPQLIDFEDHVARVLGIDSDLAHALNERAREDLGSRYELQAVQFLAVTRFPGTELPAEVREVGVRSLLIAMCGTTDGKTAYAGLIPPGALAGPCPSLGPV